MAFSYTHLYYTGYPVTPAVTVTDSDRNVDLSIGADYTVSSDAVGPGKVTATVTGTGNYKDTVTVEFTILPTGAEPVETLNLTVTPSEWTWDNGQTKAAISVTFNGTELNDTDYQLTVSKDGETPQTVTKAEAVGLLSAPSEYTITATGVGAYNGSTDTETVTIQTVSYTHLDVYKRQLLIWRKPNPIYVIIPSEPVGTAGMHPSMRGPTLRGLKTGCLRRIRFLETIPFLVAVSYTHIDVYKRQV